MGDYFQGQLLKRGLLEKGQLGVGGFSRDTQTRVPERAQTPADPEMQVTSQQWQRTPHSV